MSRRDTVIIAILLNAGLLIVLFTTSLKSEKDVEEPSAITVLASHTPEVKEPSFPTFSSPAQAPTVDQVDHVVEKYVTPQVAADTHLNFLADLQPVHAPAPVVEAPKPAPREESAIEVRVKKGDVLERIAKQHNVTVGDIMRASKLTSTRLKIGQVLKIPVGHARAPQAATVDENYYTIQAGDNPWMIAVKHHMKVEELLKLNDLDEQKARRLKAGDKIRIR